MNLHRFLLLACLSLGDVLCEQTSTFTFAGSYCLCYELFVMQIIMSSQFWVAMARNVEEIQAVIENLWQTGSSSPGERSCVYYLDSLAGRYYGDTSQMD